MLLDKKEVLAANVVQSSLTGIIRNLWWNIVKYISAMEMFEFISKELHVWILRKAEISR